MINQEQTPQPVYFKSLTIQGVNCFKSEQTIDLSNGKGEPAMWTVILGNNNTGKTTVLRCLAGIEFETPESLESKKTISFSTDKANSFFSFNYNGKEFKNPSIDYNIKIHTSISQGVFLYCFWKQAYTVSNGTISSNFHIDAYGTQRKEGKSSYIEYNLTDRTESLFKDDATSFVNAEEWFLGMMFNVLQGDEKSKNNLDRIKNALISVLPDIKDIEIGGNGTRRVRFVTTGGEKVLVTQLGSGYQSLVTWVVDFAKRMFDRYPISPNPLAEPAIVLVDEIDLHLHPEWQRKIVAFLREKFPKTQFIVTAHSPLVIQSADDINVVVLQKNETTDDVEVYQPAITNFQGWTVEEILSDLMGMGDKTRSQKYINLLAQFNEGLDNDDYNKAKIAFDELKLILNPRSAKLELLELQMAALSND